MHSAVLLVTRSTASTLNDAFCSGSHMCADAACDSFCVYLAKPCIVVLRVCHTIGAFETQFLDGNLWLYGWQPGFSAQNLLQSLLFIHCKRFIVCKSGSRQPHKCSTTGNGVVTVHRIEACSCTSKVHVEFERNNRATNLKS